MRELGITGTVRGKVVRTTFGDETVARPADLVDRQFRAPAPNRLWVAALTYVRTFSGWVYVAFVIDGCSRYVVGWQVSRSLRADLESGSADDFTVSLLWSRGCYADWAELIERWVDGARAYSKENVPNDNGVIAYANDSWVSTNMVNGQYAAQACGSGQYHTVCISWY